MTAVLIIVAVVLALVVLSAVINLLMRRRAATVRQRFPQATLVVAGANFFGQESRGKAQMRGNGTLVLTDTELYFELILPRREFHIPLPSIESIQTVRSHLGKTIGSSLLKVEFRTEADEPDSIAWYVTNLEEVKQALEAVSGQRGS